MFFIALTILLSCSIANYSSDDNSEFSSSSTPPQIVTTAPNSPTSTRATHFNRSLLYNTFPNDSNYISVPSTEQSFYTRNKNDRYIFLIKTLCCCSAIVVIVGGITTIVHKT